MNECKQEYCDFVGSRAFEDDGGWSYEVWQAAQAAAFKRMSGRFLGHKSTMFWGQEISDYLNFLSKQNVQE